MFWGYFRTTPYDLSVAGGTSGVDLGVRDSKTQVRGQRLGSLLRFTSLLPERKVADPIRN